MRSMMGYLLPFLLLLLPSSSTSRDLQTAAELGDRLSKFSSLQDLVQLDTATEITVSGLSSGEFDTFDSALSLSLSLSLCLFCFCFFLCMHFWLFCHLPLTL